jgi:hypothetical protein
MASDATELNSAGGVPQISAAAVDAASLPAEAGADAIGYEAADPVLQALWAEAMDADPMRRSLR